MEESKRKAVVTMPIEAWEQLQRDIRNEATLDASTRAQVQLTHVLHALLTGQLTHEAISRTEKFPMDAWVRLMEICVVLEDSPKIPEPEKKKVRS